MHVTDYVRLLYGDRRQIRLHPATSNGNAIHRLFGVFTDERVALTACGIRFAWGSWHGTRSVLPRCDGCWS